MYTVICRAKVKIRVRLFQTLYDRDIGRIYQSDIVTLRVFDTLACGGFLLAEYSDALAELFELNVEIVSYRSLEDLQEKVQYYLSHPDEARSIAEKGRAAVIKRHDLSRHFEYIFRCLAGEPT